jgi:hypothetical protein
MHCAECDQALTIIKRRRDGSEQIDLEAGWMYTEDGKVPAPKGSYLYTDGWRTMPIPAGRGGVWRMTPRARQRVQEGRRPMFRRPSPSGLGINPEHFIGVPTAIECWRCGLVQTLDLPGSSRRTG